MIKFRGLTWDGEWVYGLPYSSDYSGEIDQIVDGETHHDIRPETIGRFIGHKDQNHKDIYEGDILRSKVSSVIHPQDVHKFTNFDYMKSSVYWDNLWCCFDTDFNGLYWGDSETVLEIVGTIHDKIINND